MFLSKVSHSFLLLFSFCLENFLYPFLGVDLLAINSLSFLLSENYFISSSFLKHIFKDSGIFLQNSHLTVLLFWCFLLEVERSIVILTDVPLQLMQHLFMVAFKTFPFKSLIMMCSSMNLFQFILWEVILASWVCRFCLSHRFGKFYIHYFFK